jgi:hypothetical protein
METDEIAIKRPAFLPVADNKFRDECILYKGHVFRFFSGGF